MNKLQTPTIGSGQDTSTKPRKLGRGLSALLGEPVAVRVPDATALVEPKSGSVATMQHAAPATPATPAPRATPIVSETPSEGSRVVQIPVGAAEPNRFQPRRNFDEVQLKELAASIKSAGLVQPILVRPLDGGKYEIVAGERRWRAGKLAGLSHIPAVVSRLSDEQAAEWALIENIQRTDLSPMERAWAIRGLCERFGLSHAQVGDKLGIDRSSAANFARLTELEQEIRDLLESNMISMGHAKVLLSVNAGAVRIGLAKQAASQGWSVRRLEQAAARAGQAPQGPAPNVKIGEGAMAQAAALRDLEKQLSEHLGTSVRIRASAGGKRGNLVIKFFDLDHFDGLMGKIGFVLR